MIVEAILNLFIGLAFLILNLIPTLEFAIDENILNGASQIFQGLGSILPIPQLLPIFLIWFTVANFSIIWTIILKIKSFIPSMGD